MAISTMIGASIKRREDPELITGTGGFVDDLPQTGLVQMYVVRSTEPHARILGIDTARARQADGVLAVFTGKELASEFQSPLPVTVSFVPEKKYPAHYPIATDRVRYVGEPVAIVLAQSRAAAEDAAERLDIRYESLPPVVDMEKAIAPGAPVLHDELGSNLAYDVKRAGGDIEAAFRDADVRISQRIRQQRLIPVAVEPRGVVADYKPFANTLTVWSSTQIPHFVKVWLAVILGIPESQVRVVAPDVGGGFGSKIRVYPEEVLARPPTMVAPRSGMWRWQPARMAPCWACAPPSISTWAPTAASSGPSRRSPCSSCRVRTSYRPGMVAASASTRTRPLRMPIGAPADRKPLTSSSG